MNVLLLLPDLSAGGAESRTVDLAVGLRSRGCTVAIAVLRSGASSALYRLLDANDIAVLCLTTRSGRRRMRKFCREAPETLVLHSSMTAPGGAALLLHLRYRAPWIHTFTNVARRGRAGKHHLSERLAWAADRVIARHATAIHSVSAHVATEICTAVPSLTPKVHVIASLQAAPHGGGAEVRGVDAAIARAAGADRRVLALGRLVPHKRVDVLLDALAIAEARSPGNHLVIAGDGPCRTSLEARCQSLGLSDSVTFVGHTSAVQPLFEWADLLVHCSDYEGLSRACLEALGARLPVIATSSPAGRDLASHFGELVRLVPGGNCIALAHQLWASSWPNDRAYRAVSESDAGAAAQLLDLYWLIRP